MNKHIPLKTSSPHVASIRYTKGAQDRASAAGVLQRVLFLGVSVGGILGLLLACSQEQVSALFSKDPLVMEQVRLHAEVCSFVHFVLAARKLRSWSRCACMLWSAFI